ncbi:MAG: glycosyltransferase family 2 protein [bacterium]|nr:glycosyltransferase family 2 protein [bacterium]
MKQFAKQDLKSLFIIADGHRQDRPNEIDKCRDTRAIVEDIDWDCDVVKIYSDINLGCQQRISSGLNYVFDHVESAIILEDDCLPDPTFFLFCSELLNYYLNDERIMVISGNNFQFGKQRTTDSYYFSLFTHCWGWATWRRAWEYYDGEMSLWKTVKDNHWLKDILHSQYAVKYWEDIFQDISENLINSWAYRWLFACWLQNGLTVLPNVNLVSNIGFNCDATHTKNIKRLANIPAHSITFPLDHPQFIIRDTQADEFTQRSVFNSGILTRIRLKFCYYSA